MTQVLALANLLRGPRKTWRLGAAERLDAAVRRALADREGLVVLDFTEAEGPGLIDLFLGLVALQASLDPASLARFQVQGLGEDNLRYLQHTLQAARRLRHFAA